MKRKPIIVGNWKMNMRTAEAAALLRDMRAGLAKSEVVADLVVCPPFTALKTAADALSGSTIGLGAQNMHWEASGAYTGEVSTSMLRDLCCTYVILGHSERRMFFGETDEMVNRKVKAALEASLTPIVCVGETLEERKSGKTEEVVGRQVRAGLSDLGAGLNRIIVAYEPVWAIGTGLTASPEQAQAVHATIRSLLSEMADEDVAATVRIQYGGSMKPDNAADLLAQPDIDGGLIGGASLKADDFLSIARAAG